MIRRHGFIVKNMKIVCGRIMADYTSEDVRINHELEKLTKEGYEPYGQHTITTNRKTEFSCGEYYFVQTMILYHKKK
jgi:hypothetical protein